MYQMRLGKPILVILLTAVFLNLAPTLNVEANQPLICLQTLAGLEQRIAPLSEFLAKIKEQDVQFEIKPFLETGSIPIGDTSPLVFEKTFFGSYKIQLLHRGEIMGEVLLGVDELFRNELVFRSDIGIRPKFRGKGIGTMLYALAARTAYRLGGVLISTTNYSMSYKALNAWEGMVRRNWVGTIRDPNTMNDSRKPISYVFRQDLLREGFFDELDSYLVGFENIQNLKPLAVPAQSERQLSLPQLP